MILKLPQYKRKNHVQALQITVNSDKFMINQNYGVMDESWVEKHLF